MSVTFRGWIGANFLFKRVEFLLPFPFKLVLSHTALLHGVSCKISSSTVCILAFLLGTFSLSKKTLKWVIKGDKSREAFVNNTNLSISEFIQQHAGKLCLFDTVFLKLFCWLCQLLLHKLHKCLVSLHVNNPFPQGSIHHARDLMETLVSLALKIVCEQRAVSPVCKICTGFRVVWL